MWRSAMLPKSNQIKGETYRKSCFRCSKARRRTWHLGLLRRYLQLWRLHEAPEERQESFWFGIPHSLPGSLYHNINFGLESRRETASGTTSKEECTRIRRLFLTGFLGPSRFQLACGSCPKLLISDLPQWPAELQHR